MTPAEAVQPHRYVRMKVRPLDWYIAAIAGVARRITGRRLGLNQNRHAEVSNWNTEINGALAESMVARYYKEPWEWQPVDLLNFRPEDCKRPDVGGMQVRSTDYESGHLIIRPNDKDLEKTYILVIVEPGGDSATLVGSKKCGEARQDKYFREDKDRGKDSWWVPQSDLNDLPPIARTEGR